MIILIGSEKGGVGKSVVDDVSVFRMIFIIAWCYKVPFQLGIQYKT